MSPLWRDQLRIVLCPDRILIVRVKRGLRPTIDSKHCITCDPVAGMPAWFAPLNTLMQWLADAKPQKANVTIVLSNHFVRYGVLPWSANISNATETMTFARIYFEKIYGEIAKNWTLKISAAGYEEPRIVSAIDQELLDGLESMFAKVPSRIVAIEPYLMTAFNAWRKRLGKENGRFLLVEPGKACIVNIAADKCQNVKAYALPDQPEIELAEVLNRELMLEGAAECEKVVVCAVEQPDLQISSPFPISWEPLIIPEMPGFSPHADAQFGMACVGAA